jgi:hypothetical protein
MDLPQRQDLLFCEILTTNIFFPDFQVHKDPMVAICTAEHTIGF